LSSTEDVGFSPTEDTENTDFLFILFFSVLRVFRGYFLCIMVSLNILYHKNQDFASNFFVFLTGTLTRLAREFI